MLRVGSIVLRVESLEREKAFWASALGYVEAPEAASSDFALLRPAHGGGPNVSLDAHNSERALPPRIHLDLYADDQTAEIERLLALGARRVDWGKRPPDADYVILEDPEGNRFCVVSGGERQSPGASAGARVRGGQPPRV